MHAHFVKSRLDLKIDVTCNQLEHAHTSYSLCNHYPRHETEKSNSGYFSIGIIELEIHNPSILI